jgi:hypothetical protein
MKALEGSTSSSAPAMVFNRKTGRSTIELPRTGIKIPYPEVLTIAIDMGGCKTKVGVMKDGTTIEIFTLLPYVYTEDVPKGASRRLSRQVESGSIGGISALLTATEDGQEGENKDNIVFERKGKRISGGKAAGDLGGQTGLGRSKLDLLEEKVIMALIMAGISPDAEFKLSLALPGKQDTFEAEQSRVPRLLKRVSWTQDTGAYNPSAKLIKVVPEGSHGHLYSMLVDPSLPDFSKIKHMNIDGGWREIKALAFDSSNLSQPSRTQSGVREVGINEAYRRVAENIGEENHEAPEFVTAVNEALNLKGEAPKYYVRSLGESVDLWEEAQNVFDDFQDEYIEEVVQLIPAGYHHFCLFGGVMHRYGDAIAEEIEDRTGGQCVIMDPYPEYVNVLCQVVDLACS